MAEERTTTDFQAEQYTPPPPQHANILILALIFATMVALLQLKYQGSDKSPFDTHFAEMFLALHFVPGGSRFRNSMVKMSIHSTPSGSAIPIDTIVLCCGMVALDYLVTVDSYPKPDDKIRSTSFQVQGGGNTGNALTCAARLGFNSKAADDSQGKRTLNELEADGIDTSFIVVSKGGHSTISYVIVDSQTSVLNSV